jgi:purine-nucleoside phosphorylase
MQLTHLQAAVAAIKSKSKTQPRVGIVLGSGLGPFVDQVKNAVTISYQDIPHFHSTTVVGHEGKLVMGEINGVAVAVMAGRIHAYEGHDFTEVVLPVRTLVQLGCEAIILTNASGGINTQYRPGDLVMINDHLNLTGNNPLRGPNIDEFGPRFPDMSETYSPCLQKAFQEAAQATLGKKLHTGIYAGVLGPTYETPAEVRMLKVMGADLVGMSTVAEAIAATHMGAKVCGLSCVTNMASGIGGEKLMHEDIKEQANRVMNDFSQLITNGISLWAQNNPKA